MNNRTIKPIKDADTYKYLGIDENIGYIGIVNKERESESNERIFN